VHGWAPGWGDEVQREPALPAWRATDARGEPFEPWMHELAPVLATHDPHTVVLAYSWLDDAATGRFPLAQRRAAAHTAQHGHLLARAIEQAVAAEFETEGGRVHLLGHSYGARVATEAALALDRTPAQLTLFDAPDAPVVWVTGSQMQLGELLRSLPLGWGEGLTFVDNYVSMVGARYRVRDPDLGPFVEVALAPPHSPFDYRRRHNYPMRFYASTAGTAFGLGWSPLTQGATSPAPGCYEQPFGETALHHGCTGL
jgi:pimeloyl-ACP methyl ester carboxylesterase